MTKSKIFTAVMLSGTVLFGGASLSLAHAQTINPTTRSSWTRGDATSDRNLRAASRRVERTIDQLQHDDRDYGGHRVAAINDLMRARAELQAALQYDRSHPLR